jgi:hypothetical protein
MVEDIGVYLDWEFGENLVIVGDNYWRGMGEGWGFIDKRRI